MKLQESLDQFLSKGPHAVVGASPKRSKYGNKVLRAFQQAGRDAYPINPRVHEVEGRTAYPNLSSLPEAVHGVSVITPPHVTETIIEEAGRLGIDNVWMQPGAESEAAIERAHELGMNIISGGPCALVVLGFHE